MISIFAWSCGFGNQSPLPFVFFLTDFLFANLRNHFAEFLIDSSPITLEFSSHPLVLVLVQLFLFIYFISWYIDKLYIYVIIDFIFHRYYPFGHHLRICIKHYGLLILSCKPWVFGKYLSRDILLLLIVALSLLILFFNIFIIQNDLLLYLL